MITETFYTYKDYSIRLRAVTNGGFGYAIIKEVPSVTSPNGVKKLYLRKRTYNFTSSGWLLEQAKAYIDNHEENLISKLNQIVTKE